jgi:hypothetical protein
MKNNIEDITQETIDYEAAALIIDYVGVLRSENRYHRDAFDIDDFYASVFYPLYEYRLITDVDLGFDERGDKVLGKKLFNERTILVDKSISPPNTDSRYVVVLAHEMAHVVFHEALKDGAELSEREGLEELAEKQANRFTEEFLMYCDLVKVRFERYYGKGKVFEYCGPGSYTMSTEKGDKKFYATTLVSHLEQIGGNLAPSFFGIAKKDLGIKLLRLGFIKNSSPEILG